MNVSTFLIGNYKKILLPCYVKRQASFLFGSHIYEPAVAQTLRHMFIGKSFYQFPLAY